MSERYSQLFEEVCKEAELEIESVIDRRLSPIEKKQLRNTCSIRMLETLTESIKHAESARSAEGEIGNLGIYQRVFDQNIEDLQVAMEEHLSLDLSNSQLYILQKKGTGVDVLYLRELVKEAEKDSLLGKWKKIQARREIIAHIENL